MAKNKKTFFTSCMQLRKLAEDIYQVTDDIDLVYSEDDADATGEGWYFQEGHKTSQSFITDTMALKAFYNDQLKFS